MLRRFLTPCILGRETPIVYLVGQTARIEVNHAGSIFQQPPCPLHQRRGFLRFPTRAGGTKVQGHDDQRRRGGQR